MPLLPWSYCGWASFGVSWIVWGAFLIAGLVAVSGLLDAHQVFSGVCLVAMALNALLSFAAVEEVVLW